MSRGAFAWFLVAVLLTVGLLTAGGYAYTLSGENERLAEAYHNSVASRNHLANEFDKLVAEYNDLLARASAQDQKRVDEYNELVAEYNQLLAQANQLADFQTAAGNIIGSAIRQALPFPFNVIP
jgi:hypothetical protein